MLRLPALFCFLIVLTISLIAPASAFACMPVSDEVMGCEGHRPVFVRQADQVTPAAAIVSQVALIAPRPVGDSPANAIPADDKWMTIAPGASVWLKMENGRATVMDLWLDANGQGGLNLSVYAPDISSGLNANTKPTGRGTFNRLEPSHDLLWRGQSPNGGTWFALVTNGNSIPVAFKLGFVRTAVVRECSGPYWEFLPSGDYVLWPGLCK